MKFEKIHVPDCTKAFAATSAYSAKAGNAIGSVIVWGADAVCFVVLAVAPLIGRVCRAIAIAVAQLLESIGRGLKDAVVGNEHNVGGRRSAGVFDADFGGWGRRRSA